MTTVLMTPEGQRPLLESKDTVNQVLLDEVDWMATPAGPRYWESADAATPLRNALRICYRQLVAIIGDRLSTLHSVPWTTEQWALCLDATLYGLAAFYLDSLQGIDRARISSQRPEDDSTNEIISFSGWELLQQLSWNEQSLLQTKLLVVPTIADAEANLLRIPELRLPQQGPNSNATESCSPVSTSRWLGRAASFILAKMGQSRIPHLSVFPSRKWKLLIALFTLGLSRPFVLDQDLLSPKSLLISGIQRRRFYDLCKAHADYRDLSHFAKLLLPFMCHLLPTAFLEEFPRLLGCVKRQLNPRTKSIVTSLGLLECPGFAIYAAEAKGHGATIVGVQHGGYYGESFPTHYEEVERDHSWRYATYGWSESARDVPLPSPRLSQYSAIRRNKSAAGPIRILWATISHDPSIQNIYPAPCANNYLEHAQTSARAIETLLACDSVSDIALRPHPALVDAQVLNTFGRIDKSLGFHIARGSVGNLIDHVRGFDLVIFDSLGSTGFLECCAAGLPAIVYAAPRFGVPRASAEPYYDRLSEAGIFCTTEDALLKAVVAFAHTNGAWLQQEPQRGALRAFRHRFARTAGAAFSIQWSRFLWSLYLSKRSVSSHSGPQGPSGTG